jgi:hypothetical protein
VSDGHVAAAPAALARSGRDPHLVPFPGMTIGDLAFR